MSLNRNIVANYLGRAYSVGALYLFVPFYVSLLGVEAYGVIAFYTVLVTFAAVADAGLSVAFSREIARGAERPRLMGLLTTIEGCLLAATTVVAIAVFLAADWMGGKWLKPGLQVTASDIATCIRLMAISLPAQLLVSLYTAGLYGAQRQASANLLQAAYTTIRSGLVIFVLMASPSVTAFFQWHLATTVLFAVLFRVVLTRALAVPFTRFSGFSIRNLSPVLKFAGGMLAISVIAMINTQLDKVVVSSRFSIDQFGLYSLASSLAQLPVAATTPIALAFSPVLTSMVATSAFGQAGELYERYTSVIALLGALGAFGLVLFAGDVLALWIPSQSVSAEIVSVAAILALGGLFLCLQLTPYYLGLAHGDNGVIARMVGITLLVSVPAVYVGSSLYGLRGAAVPWLLLNALNFFVLSSVINSRHHAGRHRAWLIGSVGRPVALAALAMFVADLCGRALLLGPLGRCVLAAVAGGSAVLYMLVVAPRQRLARAGH